MKKFTLIAAAALTGLAASAQTEWANPKAADGSYVVQYDMETGKFLEENTFEFDETFVFALDVTGTSLETAIQNKDSFLEDFPGLLGIGVAYDIYMESNGEGAPGGSIDGRLFHIKDNIYGMTLNFYQQYCRPGKKPGMKDAEGNIPALEVGAVAGFNENFFNFGWTTTEPGYGWWAGFSTPIQGQFYFHSAPYTGTKTSIEYTYADVNSEDDPCPFEGLEKAVFEGMVADWGGYAQPSKYKEATGQDAIEEVNMAAADVVATEYFDVMGRKLNGALENGITLKRDVLSNGKAVVTKIAR